MTSLLPLFMGIGGSSSVTIEVSASRSQIVAGQSREILIPAQMPDLSGSDGPIAVNERTIVIGEQMRTISVVVQIRAICIPCEIRTIYVEA